MFISIQTICTCHGYLLFESLHCERCRSLIPFQVTDESLLDPISTNNINNGINIDNQNKSAPGMLVSYRKQQAQPTTTGRVRLRALCPFCNSATFVIRYYCKRERLYYHLRLQNCGENEQIIYKSIADTQNSISVDEFGIKRDGSESSILENGDDIYSVSGSISNQTPSMYAYDQNGLPTARDAQIESERNLYGLKDLEGDLFSVLRNGLFYDTLIQCQDDVKLQVHRCVLGGRSSWFRHLIAEYHESNTNDDYVLQISIDDIHSEVMNEILNFMYTNRCLITLQNAPDLLIVAKRFELEKLKKQIADFLLYRLTVDNAIEMLICAHEASSEALKLACIRLINRHAEKIKRTEKWKTFKTQYIDLVPELYENRVEHPTPVRSAYIPDVFNEPTVASESLRALSQLYDNPVQQRIVTPARRILPLSSRSGQSGPPSILKSVRLVQSPETNMDIPGGPYPQRNDSNLSSIIDRESPTKQSSMNSNRRPIPPITRNMQPASNRQNSDVDNYRRPVNLNEPNRIFPTIHHRTGNRNTQERIPTPPPTKTGVSKRPLMINNNPNDHMTMTRVVSIEPFD
ncbi:unnamed protein product [Adineta steineri]|uniref:BTB domain-containing protein n=2 Tax=Adineta steineri TaxID=433720 RepID=A0A814NXJ7_9BILA|nr:unnamed protein product [Adineta steineri]CAF1098351.1 unnamed protein product [Adineta steineri]